MESLVTLRDNIAKKVWHLATHTKVTGISLANLANRSSIFENNSSTTTTSSSQTPASSDTSWWVSATRCRAARRSG